MQTVYKQVLSFHTDQQIMLPVGAQILTIEVQHEELCVWYLCDPSKHVEPWTFRVVGTGISLPDDMNLFTYKGTVQLHGGALIYHTFVKQG